MLNQVVLVGRLVKDIEVRTGENDVKYSFMTLAIPRSYKNHDGIYETDFIECVLWNNIASNTAEYCKKGDIVGIKGRVQTKVVENEDKKENKLEVICEKITFLSSKPKEEE